MSKETTAVLRVFSFTKTAIQIAEILERTPEVQHEIGDYFSQRNPASRKFDRATCIFESGLPVTKTVEDHLLAVIAFFELKKPYFQELLLDCEIDIFCSYSSENGQGCISLDNSLLQKLAGLGLDIAFDLYLSDD